MLKNVFAGLGAMITTEKILQLFDADVELHSIYDFHEFINEGIPTRWALSFFNKTNLKKHASGMFPSLSADEESSSPEYSENLSYQESQTLFHLARLYAEATEFFGDSELTEQWLVKPSIGLGNRAPFELMGTSVGFELVSSELQRLNIGLAG